MDGWLNPHLHVSLPVCDADVPNHPRQSSPKILAGLLKRDFMTTLDVPLSFIHYLPEATPQTQALSIIAAIVILLLGNGVPI